MPTLIGSPPRIKLGTQPLSDNLTERLAGIEVVLSTHEPGRTTLRLLDSDYELLDGADFSGLEIGKELSVSLAEGEAATTEVFAGEIVAIGVVQAEGGKESVITVEAADGSHRLTAAAHPETWLDQTTKQIVEAVAGRHGLTPKVTGSAANLKHPYVAQAGTDHALLDQLARQIGFEWWTHGKDLHFTERPSDDGPAIKREELVSLSVRYDGRHTPSAVKVTSWDPVNTQELTATANVGDEAGALGSKASFVTKQHAAAKEAFGRDLSVGEAPVPSAEVAKTLADAIEGDLLGDGLRLEATVRGDPAVRAGTWVDLQELGTSLSGKYYVTEVRHVFGPGQDLMTDFACAPHRPERDPWQPGLRVPGLGAWGLHGPVPAVVTDVDDPSDLGRVKVKFPSLGAEIGSTWARVVAPGAGADRGLDMRPHVDDEVLVTFAHGDHAQPYVLGGVWSTTHPHPDGVAAVASSEHKRDAIRSADGALLTFHRSGEGTSDTGHEHPGDWDSELAGAVSLRSSTQSGLIVGDRIVMSTPGEDIVITNGAATITLTADGDITIEGETFSVDAASSTDIATSGGDTTVEGSKVVLKGVSEFKVDAPKTAVTSMGGIKLGSSKVEMGP